MSLTELNSSVVVGESHPQRLLWAVSPETEDIVFHFWWKRRHFSAPESQRWEGDGRSFSNSDSLHSVVCSQARLKIQTHAAFTVFSQNNLWNVCINVTEIKNRNRKTACPLWRVTVLLLVWKQLSWSMKNTSLQHVHTLTQTQTNTWYFIYCGFIKNWSFCAFVKFSGGGWLAVGTTEKTKDGQIVNHQNDLEMISRSSLWWWWWWQAECFRRWSQRSWMEAEERSLCLNGLSAMFAWTSRSRGHSFI